MYRNWLTARGDRRAVAIMVLATAAFFLAESPARAQKETFVRSALDLGRAARAPTSEKARLVSTARGRMEAALSEWDRGIAAFETHVASESREASPEKASELRQSLGRLYLERGRSGDALRELDAAARIDPRRADVHVLRALAFAAQGRPQEEARALRQAWELAPHDATKAYLLLRRAAAAPSADVARARAVLDDAYRTLLRGGNTPPKAIPFVIVASLRDELSGTPMLSDAAMRETFALLAQQQFDKAMVALRRAAAASAATGDSPVARFARGVENERAGKLNQARLDFEAAAEGVMVGRAALYRRIERVARAAGDLEGTVRPLERLVDLNPNDPRGHLDLARACIDQGRTEDAFREFVATLLINPRNADGHAGIGQIYLERGRADVAVEALRRAVALRPEAFEIRYALANALTQLGRAAEAARERAAYARGQREAIERRRRELEAGIRREEAMRQRNPRRDEKP